MLSFSLSLLILSWAREEIEEGGKLVLVNRRGKEENSSSGVRKDCSTD